MSLVVDVVRIQLPTLITSAMITILVAGCQSLDRFVWTEFAALIATSVSVAFLCMALGSNGVRVAAAAAVSKGGVQVLLLLPGTRGLPRPVVDLGLMRMAWQRLKPLLLSASVYRTDPMADRALVSLALVGAVSVFHVAQQIHSAVLGIVSRAISSPLLPTLARLAKAEEWPEFRRVARSRAISVGVLSLVAVVALGAFARLAVQLIGSFAAVDAVHLNEISRMLLLLGGVLVFGAAGQALSSTFYAMGDTRTPAKVGILGFCIGLACKGAFFFAWGLTGFAMSVSLYCVLNGLLLAVLLRADLRRRCASRFSGALA